MVSSLNTTQERDNPSGAALKSRVAGDADFPIRMFRPKFNPYVAAGASAAAGAGGWACPRPRKGIPGASAARMRVQVQVGHAQMPTICPKLPKQFDPLNPGTAWMGR